MKPADRRPRSVHDRPLHVLEVIGNAIIGGMERYVYTLAQQLPANQYKLTYLAPYESEFTASLRQLGSEVFIVAMDDDPSWRSIQFTTELVRNLKVDLLHAHLPRAHMLAGLAGRLANLPVVATIHGMEINIHELGVHRTTGTNLTVVCQQALVNSLAVGASPDLVTLVPNGVDVQRFSPAGSAEPFRQALSALGVPLEAPLLGYVGRLSWEKGPDQFVRMASHIHNQRPDIHFVMVGDGPMRSEIERLIYTHRLENVLHLAGLWPSPWEIYPALDLLVQTSRVEGMPFTLLEAMACACPVVAMGVGGVPEVVDVHLSGLLAAPGDYNGAGDAALHILSQPDLADRMGRHARQRVENGYSLSNTVRRMSGLFERLVAQSAKETIPGSTAPVWTASGDVATSAVLPVQEPAPLTNMSTDITGPAKEVLPKGSKS